MAKLLKLAAVAICLVISVQAVAYKAAKAQGIVRCADCPDNDRERK